MERFCTPAYIRDRRGDSDKEIANRKLKTLESRENRQKKIERIGRTATPQGLSSKILRKLARRKNGQKAK